MTANYIQEIKEIWSLYHEKDIPETTFDWQSWSKKEQPIKERNNK